MKKSNFDTLGVMIDMSRDGVMTVPALKKYITYLGKMGYNALMLYTEDTYEVDGEPFFGYMRGRYSKDELREIDAFASSLGIEVIPCIQTLAHLDTIARWARVPMDMGGVLLTDNERTYEFIENMFKTLSTCFRSRRIHIGMDEAHELGRGKHLDLHGYEDTVEIMKRHLERVASIAERYGYTPLIWSDMFYRSWNDGLYTALGEKDELCVPESVASSYPKNVIPVYWDYYYETERHYRVMLESHKALSDEPWFAGGVWTWRGFLPNNAYTIESMCPAIDACINTGTRNVFMTLWGNNGAECSRYSVLPSLLYIAEYARGNKDEDKIKAKFKKLFGAEYDDFMALDIPDNVYEEVGRRSVAVKSALYSDLFLGYKDTALKIGYSETFKDCARRYEKTARTSRKWSVLFKSASKLCDVLAVKYELGIKTRTAYKSGDRDELLRLAREEYTQLISRVKAFSGAFMRQWFEENKPHGYEVHDIRLGGLVMRAESCKARLIAYATGRLESIPELEDDLIELSPTSGIVNYHEYARMATSNVL